MQHAHLVPGVGHAHGEGMHGMRRVGEKVAVVAHSTPDVPSDTKASPGRTAPTPTAPAALSPAPPAMIGARGSPSAP